MGDGERYEPRPGDWEWGQRRGKELSARESVPTSLEEYLQNPLGTDVARGAVLFAKPGMFKSLVDEKNILATPDASLQSIKPENVVGAVALDDGGAVRVYYKDGTSSDLWAGQLEQGNIGRAQDPRFANQLTFVKADGTTWDYNKDDPGTSNFLGKLFKEGGRVVNDAVPVVVPIAAIAVMAYAGGVVAGGLMNGAGASGASTISVSPATANALATEATSLGIEPATLGLPGDIGAFGGTIGTDAAMEGAALGAGSTYGTTGAVLPTLGQVGTGASLAGTASDLASGSGSPGVAGNEFGGLTPPELATATDALPAAGYQLAPGVTETSLLAQFGKKLSDMTAGDWLKAASLGLVVGGSLGASTGGQTLTSSSTTDTRPAYVKAGAEEAWNNFIDDFYGNKGGTSLKDRIGQDTDYLKNLDTGYVDKTKAAANPYQKLLTDTLNQAQTGTGNFEPVSFGFGGQKMASFVPKANRDLATQTLGIGKEKLGIDTGLLDLENSRMRAFTPNLAANQYSDKLKELMQLTNTGGTTKTETGTVPGPSTFSNILQGINAGANLYNAFNYSPAASGDSAFLAKLKAALGMA